MVKDDHGKINKTKKLFSQILEKLKSPQLPLEEKRNVVLLSKNLAVQLVEEEDTVNGNIVYPEESVVMKKAFKPS